MGKVTLAVIGDPHTALLHLPEAIARVAPGPELGAEERGARAVRVILVRYLGSVEYLLGQFEGIVMSYDQSPVTTIHRVDRDTLTIDVDHG